MVGVVTIEVVKDELFFNKYVEGSTSKVDDARGELRAIKYLSKAHFLAIRELLDVVARDDVAINFGHDAVFVDSASKRAKAEEGD